jgi:hypothetical protein
MPGIIGENRSGASIFTVSWFRQIRVSALPQNPWRPKWIS